MNGSAAWVAVYPDAAAVWTWSIFLPHRSTATFSDSPFAHENVADATFDPYSVNGYSVPAVFGTTACADRPLP